MSCTVNVVREEMCIVWAHFESPEVGYIVILIVVLLSCHVHLFWWIH